MRYKDKAGGGALLAMILLSGCGMTGRSGDDPALPPAAQASSTGQARGQDADFPQLVGAPYQVGSVTYVPEQVNYLDEVGYAAVMTPPANGLTATGEAYNPASASAAHKTLPLPSYVEVTALDTGRTILVRVNDRGPMVNNRLIDLTPAAAGQLGLPPGAAIAVRMRKVSPPEQERAALRSGGKTAERLETPKPLLKVLREKLAGQPRPTNLASALTRAEVPPGASPALPVSSAAPAPAPIPAATGTAQSPPVKMPAAPARPVTVPAPRANDPFIVEGAGQAGASASRGAPYAAAPPSAPAARAGRYVVQVAAFGARDKAEAIARKLGGYVDNAGNLWRVRIGPYADEGAASQGIARARAAGFNDARIMVNR